MGTKIFSETRVAGPFETMRPVVKSLHARSDGHFDYYSLTADEAAVRWGRSPVNAVLSAGECKLRWPEHTDLIDRVGRSLERVSSVTIVSAAMGF